MAIWYLLGRILPSQGATSASHKKGLLSKLMNPSRTEVEDPTFSQTGCR
jgi:hypothetical protein